MNKAKLQLGILGCLCFGAGDWLLGYVNTGSVGEGVFYFLQQGHGVEYDLNRILLVLMLAAAGCFALYPGLMEISKVASGDRQRGRLSYLFAMQFGGYIMLHFIVAFHVLAYSAVMKVCHEEEALAICALLNDAVNPAFMLSYVLIYGSLVYLFFLVLLGKTPLPKKAVLLTPLVPMGVLCVLAGILPQGPFAYGLFTFCINFGMIVWFLYLLFRCDIFDVR